MEGRREWREWREDSRSRSKRTKRDTEERGTLGRGQRANEAYWGERAEREREGGTVARADEGG